MNQVKNKHRNFLIASIAFSVLSSLAIPLIIFAAAYDIQWAKIPISLLFWLGTVGEQIFFWSANAILKGLLSGIKNSFRPKIGLIALFATTQGTSVDIVFAISLIAFIVLSILHIGRNTVQYIFLFLLVLSFRLHCILNGKNFWYSNLLSRRDKKHD